MKCPNCSAQIYKGDKFCGECGENVAAVTSDKTNGEDTTDEHGANAAEGNNKPGFDAQHFMDEGLSLLKRTFVQPGKLIGSGEYYSGTVAGGVIGLLLLIFSIFAFIVGRIVTSGATDFLGEPLVPFSMLFMTFLYALLIFALFFLITFVMNRMIIKAAAPWEKVLSDFAVSSIIVIAFFTAGMLLNVISLYEIGAIFFAVGGLLFAFAPLYIFLRYAENNNTKLDTFYSLIIYIVLCAIAYYIVIRIIIAQAQDTILNDLMSIL